MPLRVWPLEGPMLQWMAPKPCIYGQLIVLGGLLETGRGVVRGEGGISRTRRGGVRGSEGTPVYISLHMCTKFSQNRKEKNMPVRTSIGHGGLWALYLWRTENQAGWHCRVMDYRGNQIIPGTTCDFEPTLWGLPLGSGVFSLCVWHMGV